MKYLQSLQFSWSICRDQRSLRSQRNSEDCKDLPRETTRTRLHTEKNAFTMKGMSSIIAVVLLVIITVALVGVVATNFQSLTQSSAQQAQQQTESTSERLTQTVRIESASSTEVVIRSTGTTAVQTSKLAVFIDSVLTGCTWDVAEMQQDELATCVYAAPCPSGSEVKITSPGNAHTAKC